MLPWRVLSIKDLQKVCTTHIKSQELFIDLWLIKKAFQYISSNR